MKEEGKPQSLPPFESNVNHLTYRSDITGLRAIAVLAVIGFHAFPDRIKGGFIGVDIFFVISGFLISLIILGELTQGRFSFFEFYSRRIRRLFPALLLVFTTQEIDEVAIPPINPLIEDVVTSEGLLKDK